MFIFLESISPERMLFILYFYSGFVIAECCRLIDVFHIWKRIYLFRLYLFIYSVIIFNTVRRVFNDRRDYSPFFVR